MEKFYCPEKLQYIGVEDALTCSYLFGNKCGYKEEIVRCRVIEQEERKRKACLRVDVEFNSFKDITSLIEE